MQTKHTIKIESRKTPLQSFVAPHRDDNRTVFHYLHPSAWVTLLTRINTLRSASNPPEVTVYTVRRRRAPRAPK